MSDKQPKQPITTFRCILCGKTIPPDVPWSHQGGNSEAGYDNPTCYACADDDPTLDPSVEFYRKEILALAGELYEIRIEMSETFIFTRVVMPNLSDVFVHLSSKGLSLQEHLDNLLVITRQAAAERSARVQLCKPY